MHPRNTRQPQKVPLFISFSPCNFIFVRALLTTACASQEAAKASAKALSRADQSELKGLKTSPPGVTPILRTVLMVLNHDTDSYDNNTLQWADLKKRACDAKIGARLKAFDPASMTDEENKRVDEADLDDSVKSSAAAKLLQWLRNIKLANDRVGILTVDAKRPLGMKLTKALTIQSMSPGGQFSFLGAREGDTILKVGSTKVASAAQFTAALKQIKAQGDPDILITIEEGSAGAERTGKMKKSSSISSMGSVGSTKTSAVKSQKERPNPSSSSTGPGTSLDHGASRTTKSSNRVAKSARKPARPAPKVVADANEPTSFAPKEFGTFRAKGTSIGNL